MNGILCSSASAMAHAIRHRKISSVELIPAHLERIQAVNPKLNAVVQLPAERTFEEPREGCQPPPF